jgi:hypothetical protein
MDLCRVQMLYAKRWPSAQTAAEKVLAMNYTLTTNYADAFKSGNSEAIIQYTFDKRVFTHNFDFYYVPGGDKEGSGGIWHTTTGNGGIL